MNDADGANNQPAGSLLYGDYLRLDRLLSAQTPLSSAHDEMLFIIQHQTSELWMKLAIHELSLACESIRRDELRPAYKTLSRVSRIFEQLNSAWDVLRTLTPNEYGQFRSVFGQASGFQSWQYRAIEFLVGNRNLAMLQPHAHRPDVIAELEAILTRPSLYQEALRLLQRNGFDVGDAAEVADLRKTHKENAAVLEAWRKIYSESSRYWTLYELAEKLVDFEDYFRRWRFNHLTTVERVIGFKRGSGGTSGAAYLKRMLEVVLFPELWRVRSEL